MRPWVVFLTAWVVGVGCQCGQGANGGSDGSAAPDGGVDAGSSGNDAGPDNGRPPDGGLGKIQHLVIVVLENHTFDNLFANFPNAHSTSQFPIPDGGTLTAPQCPDVMPVDLCHAHSCALTDWDDGKMDGWFQQAEGSPDAGYIAFCQYQQSQVPGLWDFASNYALADNFFASVLSPSFPGHTFLLAAQAGWAYDNPSDLIPWGCDAASGTTVGTLLNGTCTTQSIFPCFNIPSAPDALSPGLTWKFYGTDFLVTNPPIWTMFDAIQPIRMNATQWANVVPYNPNFDNDTQNGNLPNVAWLVDQDQYSGHPEPPPLSFSMCASVTWIAQHVNEVINGPQWSTSAVIITWDDFGGFVDDVPPPVQYGCDATHPYGLGFRLPAIIVSPWVKKGVFHGVVEHASVVRLIDELFGPTGHGGILHSKDPAARDDVAGSLLGAFDFNQTPLPPVPARTACP